MKTGGLSKNRYKARQVVTHDAPSFLNRHMQPPPADMLKNDFGRFFIVKVQDMIKLMKLPVPPTKSVAHTCIYLTEGKAQLSVSNHTYTIKKNDLLFVPAGSIFSFDRHDLNKGYLLHFKNDFLFSKPGKNTAHRSFEFLQAWGNPYISLDLATSLAVLHICKRLYTQYTQAGLQHTDLLQAYLLTLLAECNRVYQPAPQKGQDSAITITNHFRQLVFTHAQEWHRVTDYAQQLNISPNHLNKCVKAVTGKSPTRWINEAIVLEAKALLHQSHLPINEVAAAVGHHDPSYFSRLFKKHEGLSPVEFRKMIEKS